MRSKIPSLVGIALVLAACSDNGPDAPQDYGFVLIEAFEGPAGFEAESRAYFHRTNARVRLPSTTEQADTCVRELGFPSTFAGLVVPSISAGNTIQVNVSGVENLLNLQVSDFAMHYEMGDPSAIVPGDTATVIIGGEAGGYRAWSISAKTAEAFDVAHVPTFERPTPITLEWTPAEEPGSVMTVTLQYVIVGQGPEHVYCELQDDGEHTLPADWVDGWRVGSSKQATFARQRIASVSEEGSHLLVFAQLKVLAPPEPPVSTLLGGGTRLR